MDQIEKWLVDQADKFFTGLERDAVRMVATRWHNLRDDERKRLTQDREWLQESDHWGDDVDAGERS